MNATWPTRRYPVGVSRPAHPLLRYEQHLFDRGDVVVGIDEVGRGALAGPLIVGAVVLVEREPPPPGLADSKRLNAHQREALVGPLRDWCSDWSLGSVSSKEIDEWGLRLALGVAATRALDGLVVRPTHALIDGSFNLLRAPLGVALGVEPPPALRYDSLAHTTVVKGDATCASIAAASVLAKVHRDDEMVRLHDELDVYGWARNKGYGVPAHLAALRTYGPSAYHRRTWSLPGQLP